MIEDLKNNLKTGLGKLHGVTRQIRRYGVIIFLVFVMSLYGFIVFRIHNLSGAQPTADAINSQIQASHTPHIDQQVIKQLQSLQDNSVNVQTLFDQARNNPFQ
ncbi:MAG: hypothetical protein JWL89_488 [Candidatus Saccharibacteria bacterium]|jgi:hypothetical protein|nr:hypothetical protein [Candidatus Saccharibacteria bacterium]